MPPSRDCAAHKPTALERRWEAILQREGLAERSLYDYQPDAPIRFVSLTDAQGNESWAEQLNIVRGTPSRWQDTSTALLFRALSQTIAGLPPEWPDRDRAFLEIYAEIGILTRAAAQAGLSRKRARGALARFNAHATQQDLVRFPAPKYARKAA